MVAVKILLGIFLIVLTTVRTCNGSLLNSELTDRIDKLEALYGNYEKLIIESSEGLQRLLTKARAKAKTQSVEPNEKSLEEPEVGTENQPEIDIYRRQILSTPAAATTTRPSEPMVFHAILSNSYSVMSPKQTIVYNTVITNIGNAYDSNFGVFKARFPGLYEFVATVSAHTGYYVDVEMVLNNRMLCRAHAGSPNMDIGMCVSMVHLNTGDDVFIRHYSGRGTYIYGGYSYPSFSGHLIARD
ncbi:C1q-related factor-like [Pecten maximus]|uniref:C1q-related factor-like n=1 Tax=Pecten maximus TaxID=6579 RepID=UPI001458F678|nr:C1q-related factor-like [Pecten maximus]